MSMISSLIDELNKSADEWNSSNMFELARMCRDAADIIWQLRDDLQRANAENTKLRSELESVGVAAYLYGRGDLLAENDKLRELIADMLQYVRYPYMVVRPEVLVERARKLGIEVSE